MTIRTSILTFVVTGLACVAPSAQAMVLGGDSAGSAKSTKSVLAVMKVAGIRYHAQAEYRNERLVGPSTAQHVSPDNRAGIRGI